ncbi:hypothetical protein [Paenibacillus medicaginis]|uniref:Uncharacterized protein n=1 Tax=Paenibacillus medicaginis TaxID=1470560 RepID=A0ABV5C3G6_9BACL
MKIQMEEIKQSENPINREVNTASINHPSVTVIGLGIIKGRLSDDGLESDGRQGGYARGTRSRGGGYGERSNFGESAGDHLRAGL